MTPASDTEVEQEIDFGRYWNAILARLWLPLVGIALGVGLGYLSTLGGHTVYQAQAVVYLGQPLAPNGAAPLQSLSTNPTTTAEIVRSVSALRQAARISREDVLEQRRATLVDSRTSTQQLLIVAQLVERARVVSRASAVNTTARSIRSSLLVGALIGLVLGLIAALAWDSVVTRAGRRP